MNLIYAYAKPDGKIVYVGQTVELTTRHKQHMLYDPFNPNAKEYNYPLSRGVRKYGTDYYSLIILEENVPLEKLDDREKYWIKYYNTYWDGYNQTTGGTFPTQPKYGDDIIKLTISMLQDNNYSYNDIKNKTGLSITHIYNINIGARRPQDEIDYPIRKTTAKGTKGLKFNEEEIQLIHQDLLNTNFTFKELSIKYNCASDTISDINKGKTKKYVLKGYNYPLRKFPHRKIILN